MATRTTDRGMAGWLALGLLLDSPASGYDLWRRAERSVAHFWPVTRSALYAELPRLESRGFVSSSAVVQKGLPDKRVYAVTQAGREAFTEWLDGLEISERPRHPQQLQLFFAAHGPVDLAGRLVRDWRARAEQSEAHCLQILTDRGVDPDTDDRPPRDPRLLTALFGLRRARADQAFLDEAEQALGLTPR
ncbi:PadR family transcriptional regulator [Terrabacter lapilli]